VPIAMLISPPMPPIAYILPFTVATPKPPRAVGIGAFDVQVFSAATVEEEEAGLTAIKHSAARNKASNEATLFRILRSPWTFRAVSNIKAFLSRFLD
jgi:hypothetical protein